MSKIIILKTCLCFEFSFPQSSKLGLFFILLFVWLFDLFDFDSPRHCNLFIFHNFRPIWIFNYLNGLFQVSSLERMKLFRHHSKPIESHPYFSLWPAHGERVGCTSITPTGVLGNLVHVVKTLWRSITPDDWPSPLFRQLANSSILGMRGGLGGGFSLICFLLKVRSPHSCLHPLTWLPLRFLCLFRFLSISFFLSFCLFHSFTPPFFLLSSLVWRCFMNVYI